MSHGNSCRIAEKCANWNNHLNELRALITKCRSGTFFIIATSQTNNALAFNAWFVSVKDNIILLYLKWLKLLPHSKSSNQRCFETELHAN